MYVLGTTYIIFMFALRYIKTYVHIVSEKKDISYDDYMENKNIHKRK